MTGFRRSFYLYQTFVIKTSSNRYLGFRNCYGAIAASFAHHNKTVEQDERYFSENQQGDRLNVVAMLDEQVVGYTNLLSSSDYTLFRDAGIPEVNPSRDFPK
jgi:hypothetical protein